jgi:hypothetical protein
MYLEEATGVSLGFPLAGGILCAHLSRHHTCEARQTHRIFSESHRCAITNSDSSFRQNQRHTLSLCQQQAASVFLLCRSAGSVSALHKMTLISVTYRLEVKSATWTKYALLDLNPIAGMLPYCVLRQD